LNINLNYKFNLIFKIGPLFLKICSLHESVLNFLNSFTLKICFRLKNSFTTKIHYFIDIQFGLKIRSHFTFVLILKIVPEWINHSNFQNLSYFEICSHFSKLFQTRNSFRIENSLKLSNSFLFWNSSKFWKFVTIFQNFRKNIHILNLFPLDIRSHFKICSNIRNPFSFFKISLN
jgi:hypothetical protein